MAGRPAETKFDPRQHPASLKATPGQIIGAPAACEESVNRSPHQADTRAVLSLYPSSPESPVALDLPPSRSPLRWAKEGRNLLSEVGCHRDEWPPWLPPSLGQLLRTSRRVPQRSSLRSQRLCYGGVGCIAACRRVLHQYKVRKILKHPIQPATCLIHSPFVNGV